MERQAGLRWQHLSTSDIQESYNNSKALSPVSDRGLLFQYAAEAIDLFETTGLHLKRLIDQRTNFKGIFGKSEPMRLNLNLKILFDCCKQ